MTNDLTTHNTDDDMEIHILVWRRATFRPSATDSDHLDHLSMSDNDVMQVAMSGHLLVEPDMSSQSENAIPPNRRLAVEAEEASASATSTGFRQEDFQTSRRQSGDSTSSLEKFFDQQFNTFPMAGIPVDWSLRSDDPTEVPITDLITDYTLTDILLTDFL